MKTEDKNSVKFKNRNIVDGFMLLQQTINIGNSFSQKDFHTKKQYPNFWDAISISNHCEKNKS